MKFTTNVGSADRIIRILGGAALVLMTLTGVIGLWGWLGVVLIGTAFMQFCPIYRLVGLRTNKDA